MAKDIPIKECEFRIDDNGRPYIRISIETKIINDNRELLEDKPINVDIIPV